MMHLLYLHGFRSAPQSFKATRLHGWLQAHRPDVHWWCPQLPPSPTAAWQLIQQGIAAWTKDSMSVVGSSLGGFYATAVAESVGCRALLLNPAINPMRDLAQHIGRQSHFHCPQQHFDFHPEYLDQLRPLTVTTITRAERYALVVAKGDEVLDWREMTARYQGEQSETMQGAKIKLLEGGDHALSDFEDHLPDILEFLKISS